MTWGADTERLELEYGTELGWLSCVAARGLLHGCLWTEDEPDGWVRPWRFTEAQLRAIGSCQAWHPGLYHQMARTTSGVTLELVTDASEIVIELLPDDEPPGTSAVLRDVAVWRMRQGAGRPQVLGAESVGIEVEGRRWSLSLPERGKALLRLELDNPDERPLPGVMQLPGMGGGRTVRLWLPALRGCSVRRVWGNGSMLEAVPSRRQLLVIGDSIAQGFVTEGAFCSWPALLARRLDLDLVNQGLGGQVFQPGALADLPGVVRPAAIIVALGANYRYERCDSRRVATDVRLCLRELACRWPEVDTWVATPTWHDEGASPSHARSCWAQVPSMITANVAVHDEMRLLDGARLLDANAALLADGFEHPNAAGAAQMADRIFVALRGAADGPSGLRAQALAALADAPRTTFVIAEAIRRHRADVLLAERGCVLARTCAGEQLLWADDLRLGSAAVAMLVDDDLVDLHAPILSDELATRYGLSQVEPYYVAIYEGRDPLPVDEARTVRVLDESYLPTVMRCYTHPEWLDEGQLADLLSDGRFLGGFEGDELVAFIGEHVVGAMGLLEVFAGHRRKGWAGVLEVHQINRTLERGDVPWAQVYPGNRASLRLQRSLGLTILPSTEQCFVSRADMDGR